jgi:hypothetical protein
MKKLFFVAMAVVFLAGCGATVRESGYYEHSTHYKDCEHMKFSTCGYKNINKKYVQESKEGNWWGLEVEAPTNK